MTTAVQGDSMKWYQWYFKCMRNYANFQGRAQRKEFWMFLLFFQLFSVLVAVLALAVFPGSIFDATEEELDIFFGVVSIIYLISHLLPYLAVTVRRLHDMNLSGLWLPIVIIPLWLIAAVMAVISVIAPLMGAIIFWIIVIILIIWMSQDSHPGDNKYGPNPKGVQR